MTTSISMSSPAQTQCFPCECISNICKSVYDIAMSALKAIRDLFSCCLPRTPIAPTEPAGSTTAVSNQFGTTIQAGPLNVVAFYRGAEANNNGVNFNTILGWSDQQLESAHNYIQWLFPLPTFSAPNPTGPILDRPTILAIRNDAAIKNNMVQALHRMLSFYGLQMDDATHVVTRAPNFNARIAVWLQNPAGHHNFLRITRIIHSLNLLGLPEYGHGVFNIMGEISNVEGNGIVPQATFNHWYAAQNGAYP